MVEPAADCQKCPNRFGVCAEFTALDRSDNPYNREWCHWGAESIAKEKRERKGFMNFVNAIPIHKLDNKTEAKEK